MDTRSPPWKEKKMKYFSVPLKKKHNTTTTAWLREKEYKKASSIKLLNAKASRGVPQYPYVPQTPTNREITDIVLIVPPQAAAAPLCIKNLPGVKCI